ncbi:endonuclease/exonuclease/phosphatase family protein [Amantichitinum ursilacus]|uniref:Endonuclease/exonuclease/phosphatase domain-containing protein n=1 Tax=Amantichitinum ursilacus TaxID=857265 RepID=A0A0N0GRH3_9NEIS|nr:endonuclease/exonuclease/phosphatase family protein [Amantichitinum ursilacus]KPC55429.1 hypothetical protein WG78_02190 [Amantichitinum ursilacus]
MAKTLKIASYNIHKGMSALNRRLVVHDVRKALEALEPDVVFLQEVQGSHERRAQQFTYWPESPQHEFLEHGDLKSVYGRNAVHKLGHHGNALLSRFPVVRWGNHDITLNRFEQRGLLHCVLDVPGWQQPLHAFCVHLNLLGRDRRKQLNKLVSQIHHEVPDDAPLVIAGDFNDWRREATHVLQHDVHVVEAFEALHGAPARSFPVKMPVLSLDRIYVRGFNIELANVLGGAPWTGLSDHAPLYTVLRKT